MRAFRSYLFLALFYAWGVFWVFFILPLLICPRRWVVRSFAGWARGIMFLLWAVCGIRVEVRGRQFIPAGAALIAPKHQSMFDVFAQFVWLPDSCFVTKQELKWIPMFGWYAQKARMIWVDRAGQSAALRKLVADAKDRFADNRQLVIFPKATAATRASRAITSPASPPSTARSTSRWRRWPPTAASTGPARAS